MYIMKLQNLSSHNFENYLTLEFSLKCYLSYMMGIVVFLLFSSFISPKRATKKLYRKSHGI